jgi:hypothetical protein
MARVFIIGDIHGCCKTFKKLVLEKISIKKVVVFIKIETAMEVYLP